MAPHHNAPLPANSPARDSILGSGNPDGHRLTRQRRLIYEVLSHREDHPTANQIFMAVQPKMPSIALGTVYNCLEFLVHNGLARQVNLGRDSSRFCANLAEHSHFFCTECDRVADVLPSTAPQIAKEWALPTGWVPKSFELNVRGLCPDCAAKIRNTNHNQISQ